MADSDLLAVLAEMLNRQDRQTEILNQFMEVSVRHFESELNFKNQQTLFSEEEMRFKRESKLFNEKFIEKLNTIEKILLRMTDLEDRVKRIEDMLMRKAG